MDKIKYPEIEMVRKNLIKVIIKYFQNMDFVSHIPKISAKEK